MKTNTLRKLIPVLSPKKESKLTSIQTMKDIIKRADTRYMNTRQHASFMFAKDLIENNYTLTDLEKMFL